MTAVALPPAAMTATSVTPIRSNEIRSVPAQIVVSSLRSVARAVSSWLRRGRSTPPSPARAEPPAAVMGAAAAIPRANRRAMARRAAIAASDAGAAASWLGDALGPSKAAAARPAIPGEVLARALAARAPLAERLYDPTGPLFELFRDHPWLGPWMRRPEALRQLTLAVGAAHHGGALRRMIDRRRIMALTGWLSPPVFRWAVERGAGAQALVTEAAPIERRIETTGRWAVRGLVLSETQLSGLPELGQDLDRAAQALEIWEAAPGPVPASARLALARVCAMETGPWTEAMTAPTLAIGAAPQRARLP